MVYDSDDKLDEQVHLKYHHEKDRILNYSLLKHEKLVHDYIDSKCIVIEYGIDSKQAIGKAIQVLEYVDSQLGIRYKNDNLLNEDNHNKKVKDQSKFYLFISCLTKKIDGFCLAEHINHAYKIEYTNNNQSTFTLNQTKPIKALCGISRIWVSPNSRRQGIASKLLECVCKNFLYVQQLEPEQIAFSDPTQMGQHLARKFFNTNSFLIYNENSD